MGQERSRPQRVVDARRQRAGLLRLRERDAVRARRQERKDRLDLQRRRCDQGLPHALDGVLYFGAYGGTVYAVRARDGSKIWTSGAGRGLVRSGNFYATAAVAFGRVYIGATDGRAYSFSAKDGRVAWAHQTGRYVYSSAAVKDVPGRGRRCSSAPTTARSTRWTRSPARSAGRIERRQDLRSRDDHRRHDLLLRPREGDHARPEHPQRQDGVPVERRRLRPDHLRRPEPLPDRRGSLTALEPRAATASGRRPSGEGARRRPRRGGSSRPRGPRCADSSRRAGR